MQEKGILLVLSGPSGAGKGTICKYLLAHNPSLKYSISATTRAPRTGELDGHSYHFVSKDTFQEMIAQDELLEHAEVYGNYYGTPKNYVQKLLDENLDVILEIDPQGAMQIKNKFPIFKIKITKLFLAYFLAIIISFINAYLIYQTDLTNILILHLFRRFEYISLFFIGLNSIKSAKDFRFLYIFKVYRFYTLVRSHRPIVNISGFFTYRYQ